MYYLPRRRLSDVIEHQLDIFRHSSSEEVGGPAASTETVEADVIQSQQLTPNTVSSPWEALASFVDFDEGSGGLPMIPASDYLPLSPVADELAYVGSRSPEAAVIPPNCADDVEQAVHENDSPPSANDEADSAPFQNLNAIFSNPIEQCAPIQSLAASEEVTHGDISSPKPSSPSVRTPQRVESSASLALKTPQLSAVSSPDAEFSNTSNCSESQTTETPQNATPSSGRKRKKVGRCVLDILCT